MIDSQSYKILKKFYKANAPLRVYYEDNKLIQILHKDNLLKLVPIEGEQDEYGGQMYYSDRLEISDLGIKTYLEYKEGMKRWQVPVIISALAFVVSIIALIKSFF